MTDHLLPPDELDELATAYLDGVATQAQRARVESDPELVDRVEAMMQLRRRLSEPVLVVPSTRDLHLAAALAAFDEVHGVAAAGDAGADQTRAPAAPVVDLAQERRRRRRWVPAMSVAAASVLVLGAGMMVLDGGGGGGGADVAEVAEAPATTAAAATTAADLARSAPTEETAAGGSAGEVTPKLEATPPTGSADEDVAAESMVVAGDAIPFAAPVEVESEEQLPATVDSFSTATLSTTSTASADPCPAGGRTYVADIVWQGEPAHLYVLPDLATRTEALVLDLNCVPLAQAPLAG